MSVNIVTTIFGIIYRLFQVALLSVPAVYFVFQLHTRDFFYTVLAFILPYRPVGKVIQPGRPGYGGIWPTYAPPSKTDSRSPCPGLNALANHGILPRDGRKITYAEMAHACQHAYNLAPTLAEQLTSSAFTVDQSRGYLDLYDLNALGVVQHDASFTRHDIAFSPDQSAPDPKLVEDLLGHATGTRYGGKHGRGKERRKITLEDLAYYNGYRRAQCKAVNGQYSLSYSFLHKFFGSGNCAFIYGLFDGDVEDLRIWLGEERIPDGWEPKVRWSYGQTIVFAQKASLGVEFNTYENQKLRPGDYIPTKPIY